MGAVYTLGGNASGAITAVGSVTKEFDKTDKAALKAAQSAEKLEQRLKLAADKIKEAINPQEKLNRLYRELGEHVKAGRLTIEQATAAGVKYRQELGLAAKAIDNAGRANEGAFGANAIRNLTAYFTGMASVGGAISLIRGELAEIVKIDERAAQRIQSVAQAEASLRKNIFALPDEERQKLLAAGPEIAGRHNLPQQAIYNSLAGTISATGKTDLTIDLVNTGAAFTRNTEELAKFTAGLGDIIATTDIRDAKDALGFLTLTQASARIVDPAKVAENVAKVTAAFTSPIAGGTGATGGAVFAALTRGGADPRGESTRTGAVQLVGKTADFFKKQKQFDREDVDTIDERISILLGDRELAKKFLQSNKFESAVQGGIEKLFLGDQIVRGAYDEALVKLQDPAERIRKAEEAIRFVSEGDIQRAARTNDVVGSITEEFDLKKANLGILSEEKQKELISLVAAGTGQFHTQARFFVAQQSGFDSTSRDEAINIIEKARREFGPRELQDAEGGAAQDALNEMLIELKRLRREQRSKRDTRGE